MMRKKRYFKAVLAISMAMGFALSCASSPTPLLPVDEAASQWDATVDKHIPDAKRADRLKQLGRQLGGLQESLSADIAGLNEKALTLNINYESTRDDMRQLVADFAEKRNTVLARYRDIIFSMRHEVSAEEWKTLTN